MALIKLYFQAVVLDPVSNCRVIVGSWQRFIRRIGPSRPQFFFRRAFHPPALLRGLHFTEQFFPVSNHSQPQALQMSSATGQIASQVSIGHRMSGRVMVAYRDATSIPALVATAAPLSPGRPVGAAPRPQPGTGARHAAGGWASFFSTLRRCGRCWAPTLPTVTWCLSAPPPSCW